MPRPTLNPFTGMDAADMTRSPHTHRSNHRSPHRFGRLLRVSVHTTAAVLIVVSLTGCLKQILFLGLLIHGPPSIER